MINKSIKLQLPKRWLALALTIGMIAVIVLPAGMVSAVGPNLALNRPAVSSSIEGTGFEAGKAVDGSGTTRWASVEPAPNAEWIYVDLGSTTAIGEVILKWEAAYGKSYQVQTSNDAVSWTTIYTTTTGDGATDDLVISGSGRYVRVYMTVRGTAYGYSLWELEVYGTGGATVTNTSVAPTATRTNTPVGPTATRTNTSVPPTATNTQVSSGNLALNKPATASSIEGTGFEAAKAVDGSATTRWASVDPATTAQWIYVDLGASSTIARVVLKWEAAYGKSYQVQTSGDATNWTPIYTTTTGDGATDDLVISGSGRYVRVYMTVRGTAYGYSLYELEVYGTGGPTPTNTAVGPTATRTNTPVGPTATPTRTNTSVPATATRTNTPAIPTATSVSTGNGSVWMGHNWNITSGGMAGVAPGSPSNIFVDANGYLHMKITNSGGSWTAAETFTQDKIGFGTYQWQIEGNVDNMDKATVLGLFPYGPVAGIGGDGEDEIDIELSKWNNTCSCNADFTFWPATGHGNLGPAEDLFNFSLGGGNLVTARFVWRSNSIVGYVMSGLVPIGNAPTNILRTFSFTPTDYTSRIPQVALPLGINFWAFQTTPATNQEVILRNFQYVP